MEYSKCTKGENYMSKKNIIIVAIVAVLALGTGVFFVINSGSDENQSTTTNSSGSNSAKNQEQVEKGSLKSLASSDKPRECAMSYSGANGTGTGTMYSDGKGRARMQLNLKTEKGNIGETNQIIKENKSYSWFTTNGQTMGMVMDMSKVQSQTQQAQSQTSTNSPSPDQSFEIKCKSWTVDESKLTLPAGVNFLDLSNISVPTTR